LRTILPSLAALLAITVAATPARAAGPDRAEALFDRGVADLEAGRFDKACPAIQESFDLDPRPGTLFTLAECESKRGRITTAIARYEAYLALYAKLPADKQKKQGDRERVSREALARLAPAAPEITVSLPAGAPAPAEVTIDGGPLATGLGAPARVDPGEHVIRARGADGATMEKRVKVAAGDRRTVEIALAAAAITPPPREEGAGPSARRIAAFATGGAGVAALVAGAVTGGLAVAKKGVVDDNCGAGIGVKDPSACNAQGLSAADGMKTLGLASTVLLCVGGAAAATGVVLFATEPRASEKKTAAIHVRAELAPGGVIVRGRF
jgi:hypothetical protein